MKQNRIQKKIVVIVTERLDKFRRHLNMVAQIHGEYSSLKCSWLMIPQSNGLRFQELIANRIRLGYSEIEKEKTTYVDNR